MTYTLLITGSDGAQATALTDYRDDATTIADVQHMLSAAQPRIVIGLGSGEAVRWLGAWDWRAGAPAWTPEVGPNDGPASG